MARYIPGLFTSALIAVTIIAAQEPVKPKMTAPKIITATRQVTVFTGLEKQMLQAVQKKDKAGLEALLEDDLEIYLPDADPLPAEDWVNSVMTTEFSLSRFTIRQMSALDMGDMVIVKFDRVQEATFKGKSESGEFFVVDVWRKSGDSWKLASRYVTKISDLPTALKTQPRPTGKE